MCLSKNMPITDNDRVKALGPGMAGRAGTQIKNNPAYLRYAAEAQMNGEKAMSPEEWAKQNSGG